MRITPDLIEQIKAMRDSGLSIHYVAKTLDVSRNGIRNHVTFPRTLIGFPNLWRVTLPDLHDRSTRTTEGCLLWAGRVRHDGYGTVGLEGKPWLAHRLAYTLAYGEIPEELTVDHVCFERSCINPDHLRLLTHSQNASNKLSVYSDRCSRGHVWTDENTLMVRSSHKPDQMRRRCRACHALSRGKRRAA